MSEHFNLNRRIDDALYRMPSRQIRSNLIGLINNHLYNRLYNIEDKLIWTLQDAVHVGMIERLKRDLRK